MARSGIIYGATGTFKTTAIAHFARWIARKTGKATLLFSADGGGWAPCDEEVQAGMIRPYRCDANSIPLPIIRLVSTGYWPRNPDEPDISKVVFSRVNWDEVGGIAVEGVTSLGTMLMRHCADKNLKTGETGTSTFRMPILVAGDDGVEEVRYEAFSGNSKAHYGFVQNQLYSLIMNFISLPVSYVLFTGHEKKFTDEGDVQYGISVPGKAITPLLPTWVGDCIHAQDYRVAIKVKVPDPAAESGFTEEETYRVRCRYYFEKHPDPGTGIIFEAKPRVTHSKVADLARRFPGGFFVPTPDKGFDEYLDAVDFLANDAAQADSLKGWRDRQDAKLGRKPASAAAPTPAPVPVPATTSK